MEKKVCLHILLGILVASIVASIALLFLITTRGDRAMTCVFCDIINKKTNTEILFENDNFIGFKDIKPASKFHFLMIPKKHIVNTKALTTDDKPMLLEMKNNLLDLLEKNGQTTDISLGFHIPPFNSIKHLHLHGIAPKSEMGFIARLIFKENTFYYKDFETVFNSLPEPAKDTNEEQS